jgi:hypothetical protein
VFRSCNSSNAAADLAEQDTIRAVAQGGLEKIANRHWRDTVLLGSGLKADQVCVVHLNLCGVLDQQHTF